MQKVVSMCSGSVAFLVWRWAMGVRMDHGSEVIILKWTYGLT